MIDPTCLDEWLYHRLAEALEIPPEVLKSKCTIHWNPLLEEEVKE